MLAWSMNESAFALVRKIVTYEINAVATSTPEGDMQETIYSNNSYDIN
jgi:hypothetical protein